MRRRCGLELSFSFGVPSDIDCCEMLRAAVTTTRMMKTGGMGLWAGPAALPHVYISVPELF